jgi:hypothetical protein
MQDRVPYANDVLTLGNPILVVVVLDPDPATAHAFGGGIDLAIRRPCVLGVLIAGGVLLGVGVFRRHLDVVRNVVPHLAKL